MKSQPDSLASAVLNSLESQIAVLDCKGAILYVNQAWIDFGQANGLPRDYVWTGMNYLNTCVVASTQGDRDGVEVYAGIQNVIGARSPSFAYEYPCHSPDEQRWFMMRIVPLRDLADSFVVSHHIITERKLAEERIELQNRELAKLAVTDKLTQLVNRAKLDAILEYEIVRASRYGSAFSVVMVDVDYFKRINDNFGHPVGDTVLAGIAELLRANLRKSDVVGRWGGEEFLILLPVSNAETAYQVAENLRTRIAGHEFPVIGAVTCSYGVAEYQSGQTTTEVIECADLALYRAKRNGRNRGEVGEWRGSHCLEACECPSEGYRQAADECCGEPAPAGASALIQTVNLNRPHDSPFLPS